MPKRLTIRGGGLRIKKKKVERRMLQRSLFELKNSWNWNRFLLGDNFAINRLEGSISMRYFQNRKVGSEAVLLPSIIFWYRALHLI